MRRAVYLKDMLHIVLERIFGVVREHQLVLDQVEHLNFQQVVDDFLLEWIECLEDARCPWRDRGGTGDDIVRLGGRRHVDGDACHRCVRHRRR